MRHAEIESDQMPGQDSFLDVITNIVGILILLVLVVGVRTSRSVSTAAQATAQEDGANDELQAAKNALKFAQLDADELASRAESVHREMLLKEQERQYLVTYVASGEQELAGMRARLSAQQQRDFDLRERMSAAERTLDELTREQVALVSQPPQIEQIASLPTPLAETVTGREIHLRLAERTVSVIPLDALLKEFKAHAEDNAWRLRDQDHFISTVGPIEGYRLRYALQKRQFVARSQSGLEQRGTAIQLVRWELLPDTEHVGEPVDQSLGPHGDLRRCLQRNSPATTTVTIWVYPESFGDFRKLKKALYELGYATAARPLPTGIMIGGSPNGSRSSAQ